MTNHRDAHERVHMKAAAILHDLLGSTAHSLLRPSNDPCLVEKVREALKARCGENQARDVGFHLTDWSNNNAFLAALHLRPEAFAVDEVEAGVLGFLIHAPNHIAAAAKLVGHPVEDVFDVDALEPEDD